MKNEFLTVRVLPSMGLRVLNAIDHRTGRSIAGNRPGTFFDEEPFVDYIGWTAGAIEPSFPYFEHGTNAIQPGSYRIVKKEDGSMVVAMVMAFLHH